MLTALLVIAILVFLIVVHELGHFVVAKLFRVRVEEFGIGYPPRAMTLGRIGETEYTLNWIPFGGFVRLFGDVGEGLHGRGSLVDANRGVQAAILLAGVAMNALAAWMLFTAALHAGVPRVVQAVGEGETARLVVATIISGSPADSAGLLPGDELITVEDARGPIDAMTPTAFAQFVQARGGTPITITYQRGETETSVPVTPAHAVIPEEAGRPAVGLSLYLLSVSSLPWGEAASAALPATINAFKTVGKALWGILEKMLSGAPSLAGVVGPLGLVGVVGDAAESGLGSVLTLAAFISVNLAIINLIPIPALDGGRLAVLGIETVARRSAPRLILQILSAIGVLLIVLLMITVTLNDISRLVS